MMIRRNSLAGHIILCLKDNPKLSGYSSKQWLRVGHTVYLAENEELDWIWRIQGI